MQPILDEEGRTVASVWQDVQGNVFLPFDPEEAMSSLWSERYKRLGLARRTTAVRGGMVKGYYALRPLMPRAVQIRLQRYAAHVELPDFPAWPAEHCLHDLYDWLFDLVAEVAGQPVLYLNPWPARQGLRAAPHPRRGDGCRSRQHRGAPGARARARFPLVVELRSRAVRHLRRTRPKSPGRGVRDRRARAPSRRPRHGLAAPAPQAAPGHPEVRRPMGRGRLPLAGDPAHLETRAHLGLRLRLDVLRHRTVRAGTGGLLHVPAVLQRAPCRATDDPAHGPHALRDPRAHRRPGLVRQGRPASAARGNAEPPGPPGLRELPWSPSEAWDAFLDRFVGDDSVCRHCPWTCRPGGADARSHGSSTTESRGRCTGRPRTRPR